jgi:hypothetical protein
VDISVTANVNDGGTLSYQWYSNAANSNSGGTPIPLATNQTYTPSTSDIGETYYYVAITNTNNNVNGNKVVSVKSGTAKISVNAPITHFISFYDENIDFIETVSTNEGMINPSNVKSGSWYRANETSELTTHNLSENISLYALPNVQEITNQIELNNVRNDLDGKYILLNDIPLDEDDAGFDSSAGWNPIGDNSNRFTGIFNGNNNKIINIWINSYTAGIGLFGYVEGAKIRNLGMETVKEIKGYEYVGGIAGYIHESSITNIYFIGNVSGEYYVGGIVGVANIGDGITDSYFIGNVNGNYRVGGISGLIYGSNITNVYSNGNISGVNCVGGITGEIDSVNIANSYSAGNVSGNSWVGGIAGYVASSNITNSYSAGNVSGYYAIGGIAGFIYDSSVTNNAAINPSVTGSTNVNRIVGYINSGTVTDNFALDDMDGSFTDNGNPANHGADKTDEQFKQEATYGNGGLGWLFDGNNDTSPWKINEGNGYPYLYWQEL